MSDRHAASKTASERLGVALEAWTICLDRWREIHADLAVAERHLGDATRDDRWQRADMAAISEYNTAADAAAERAEPWWHSTRELLAITRREFAGSTPPEVQALMRVVAQELDEWVFKRLAEHQMAAELTWRFADPTGASVASALRDWWIPADPQHQQACWHVLTRPPQGTEPRWREVLRRSTHEGFLHWINVSTRWNVFDEERPERRKPKWYDGLPADEKEKAILRLASQARAAGVTDRQLDALLAHAGGERSAATAARWGVSDSTVRNLRSKAKRKLVALRP